MMSDTVLDAAMIEQMLGLLPAPQQAKLFMLAMDEAVTDEVLEEAAAEALKSIDWETQREQIRGLISQLMPLERLVPDIYAAWRPVIRDCVAFVGSQLSTERLVPKLVEQMMLPAEMPLEKRLLILISQMPSLQKMGQIVARNPHLEPSFRAELSRLENAIEDMTVAEVRAEVERQLGHYLKIYRVEMEEVLLAEASVSAVVRFTWHNPVTRQRERGVFKVLKPYVLKHFPEEMGILQGLADFFDENRQTYALPQVGFRNVMDDVRHLLEREVNLPGEQAALTAAYQRYRKIAGVRVPRLIRELSTPYITAMSEEQGVKVTDAFSKQPTQRKKLAERLIEALIAVPMFAPEENAFFHADTHAGNLFADQETGDVVILDWALTERLSRRQRRQTVLLTLAIALRDEQRAYEALSDLTADDLDADESKGNLVREHLSHFFSELSPFKVAGLAQVMGLLDGMAFSGISFPRGLLMFRKIIFTLEGVLHDVAPGINIDSVLARYALKLMFQETPRRLLRPLSRGTFRTHLSNYDLTVLVMSLPLLGNRLWLQSAEQMTNKGLREIERAFSLLLPSTQS